MIFLQSKVFSDPIPLAQDISFLSHVLNGISDGVFHINQSLGIDFWNTAAESLSGYSAQEALGKSLATLVLTETGQKQLMDAIQETLENGSLWYEDVPTQTEIINKNGTRIPVEVKVRVQLGIDKSFQGITGIVRDMRQQLSDEAEHEAILTKGLGNAIHDLKNPIGTLANWVEALSTLDGVKNEPEINFFVGKISKVIQELKLRVRRELNLVQIMTGSVRLNPESFMLGQELHEVCRLFEQQLAEKELQMKVVLSDSVPTRLLGDTLYIREIFQNFVGNAIAFTPAKGAVEIHISSTPRENNKLELNCFVVDTGVGMTEEQASHLFLVSGQSSSTSKEGDGLGLMKAKKLIEAMGGQVNVVSAPGQGTTIAFTLQLECLQ